MRSHDRTATKPLFVEVTEEQRAMAEAKAAADGVSLRELEQRAESLDAIEGGVSSIARTVDDIHRDMNTRSR